MKTINLILICMTFLIVGFVSVNAETDTYSYNQSFNLTFPCILDNYPCNSSATGQISFYDENSNIINNLLPMNYSSSISTYYYTVPYNKFAVGDYKAIIYAQVGINNMSNEYNFRITRNQLLNINIKETSSLILIGLLFALYLSLLLIGFISHQEIIIFCGIAIGLFIGCLFISIHWLLALIVLGLNCSLLFITVKVKRY